MRKEAFGTVLVSAMLTVAWFGCATASKTTPNTNTVSKVRVDESEQAIPSIQNQWRAYKEQIAAEPAAPDMTGADLSSAQLAATSDRERSSLEEVYQARLGTPVFLTKGHLTHAGRRARDLAANAHTHGIVRPAGWPAISPLEQSLDETALAATEIVARPLPRADALRIAQGRCNGSPDCVLETFPTEALGQSALNDLMDLERNAEQRRTAVARLDGALVVAMWKLWVAARPPDRRPVRRRASWEPDMSIWKWPETALDRVVPVHDDYDALRGAYMRYVKLARSGGLPEVPMWVRLPKLGRKHEAVPALRRRLEAEGFDAGPDDPKADPRVYDEAIVRALLTFQRTRALPLTGELDRRTRAALRVSADTLVRRLQFGLLRWQMSATRDVDYYVRVAIARYQVQLVRGGRLERRYTAVVGKSWTQTPRFRGVINHLVVHPWWWGLREKPRAVPPGPRNPLGQLVLKIHPPGHLVYLHGTNQPKLMSQPYRMYSHGCIRLKDPIDLATRILDTDPGKETGADLAPLLARDRRTTRVYLEQPVPVFLEYNTTYVSEETGHVHFAADRYGDDSYILSMVNLPDDPIASWSNLTFKSDRRGASANASQSD